MRPQCNAQRKTQRVTNLSIPVNQDITTRMFSASKNDQESPDVFIDPQLLYYFYFYITLIPLRCGRIVYNADAVKFGRIYY